MNKDLFDDLDHGTIGSYEQAFATWKHQNSDTLRRESSLEVYEHMWRSWTTWAVGCGIPLENVQAADLDNYLRSRGNAEELSLRYAWRLLRLVDRVFQSHATLTGRLKNSAAADLMASRPEIRFANAADADTLPTFFAASEAKRLVVYLTSVRPGRLAATHTWQEVRNRVTTALMLGAGITPGEARALKIQDVFTVGGKVRDVPWKLRVGANGNAPARETPIAGWAGSLLAHWLTVRAEQAIPGPVLFPSTRAAGKPWSKMSQYLAVKETLRAAGMDEPEGGAFRLRHTFAIRQLRRGKNPQDVARWLGVSDPDVMARYERVLAAPVDVV